MSPNDCEMLKMERQKKKVRDVAEALRVLGMRAEKKPAEPRGSVGADAPEIQTLALARRLPGLLNHLDERKRDILCLRFGITGIEPATLQAIGTKYELTRERIRQIQNTAIDQLTELLDVSPN